MGPRISLCTALLAGSVDRRYQPVFTMWCAVRDCFCADHPHSERARYRIHFGCRRNWSFGESSAYPRWSETVKQCFCPGAVIHTRSVLGIVNFSGTLRWVDITVLIKIFQSPDDIARPRVRVFDADHPRAYIRRGVFVGIDRPRSTSVELPRVAAG